LFALLLRGTTAARFSETASRQKTLGEKIETISATMKYRPAAVLAASAVLRVACTTTAANAPAFVSPSEFGGDGDDD
jgi:hypothetical protein